MNRYFFLILITYFFCACSHNNKAGEVPADDDTIQAAPVYYRWESTLNDSNGRLEMKKMEGIARTH